MRSRSVVSDGSATNNSAQTTFSSNRKQLNVVKTLVIISLVFVVTWLPAGTTLLLYASGYPLDFEGQLWSTVSISHYSNLLINPALYVWQYESVRNSIKLLFARPVK